MLHKRMIPILLTIIGLLLVNYEVSGLNSDHSSNIYRVDAPPDTGSGVEDDHSVQSDQNGQSPPVPVDNIWAVLVAGSNGYYNYRHQADVCHAYQILIRNGVPREQIIVMMYDDIANSTENPTPGVIINRPDGPNVYPGVKIDYKGEDVTPDVFKKVLLGDEEALSGTGSGRVLKSGPNDHVFVNFVDHGAPGLIAFPAEELGARDLLDTLQKMYTAKKYAKLVFYLEACESGSMFKNLLPPHWNIFATTAANDQESSYACYMDSLRNTYLGDVYSVMWMENSDQVDLEKESLQAQFLVVRNETNTSHVQEFGDKGLRKLPVAQFLGELEPETKLPLPDVNLDAVESGEVVRKILEHRLGKANSTEEVKSFRWKLKRFHKLRKLVRSEMKEIVSKVINGNEKEQQIVHNIRTPITNWDCYEAAWKHYSTSCLSIAKNPYVTRKLYVLVNLCERGWDTDSILQAMTTTCNHPNLLGIY